jgi:thymidylate kinase
MKLKEEDEKAKIVPWFVLDARKSIEEIHQDIVKVTEQVIESSQSKDISPMWI